ncbi:MAG: hypothetical protein V1857_05480 [archaeon]
MWQPAKATSLQDPLSRNLQPCLGHMLLGSRGNYSDVHDMDAIAEKYIKASFDPATSDAQLRVMEGELRETRLQ